MTVALVEQVSGANAGKSTTLDLVLTSAPTSGNLLVVGVNEEATEVPSLNNATWTALNTSTYLGGHSVQWWYKIAAGTESATTTLTWTGGTAAVGALLEFSNTDGWVGLGSEATIATGSSSSPAANSVGGGTDQLLHVGLCGMDGNQTFSSPTNSYTLGTAATRGSVVTIQSIYRILTSTTSLDWGVTASGSNDWFATHASFQVDVASDVTAAPIFDGTGDVVLAYSVDVPASPVFDGTGDIVLASQVDVPVSLTLDGTGDVVLATATDVPAAPVFDGTGDVVLATAVDVPVAPIFDGVGDVQLVTSVESGQEILTLRAMGY